MSDMQKRTAGTALWAVSVSLLVWQVIIGGPAVIGQWGLFVALVASVFTGWVIVERAERENRLAFERTVRENRLDAERVINLYEAAREGADSLTHIRRR